MIGTLGFLLDTNVISEPSKRRPSSSIVTFIDSTPAKMLYLSVLTFGELRKGAARKEPHAADLIRLIDAVERRFAQRTLPVTREIAGLWGQLSARRTRPVIDTLLAATALAHNLTLVTRNIRDFSDTGVLLLNPWVE